ncbi:hypothetical protein CTAYLR_003181 [Chrysophaeum taylorii]|uniref:Fatty acid desaturase domain-containing protein n=1 Tax=Chrysophaeum taylorii TaxID=2483200 RepID=A0AAD7UBA5_9STRA|nr:hypothetical protein CTAYLR_003181 [Chrysophaeum taylorii]
MGKGAQNPLILPKSAKELLSGPSYAAKVLAAEDAWIADVDFALFHKEVHELGKTLAKEQGEADVAHLQKIIWWSRLCQYIGVATMWWRVNPISIFFLSLGTLTRWTIVAHHVCHGGFDKCSTEYNRFKFGVGSLFRRVVDWLDWMLVEAWNVEHNQLHHYHLGEDSDPDLVETNMAYLREMQVPKGVKYVAVLYIALTWKWWYYAPNTFKQLKATERRKRGQEILGRGPLTFDFKWLIGRGDQTFFNSTEFLVRCLLPYFVQRFALLPLPLAFFSRSAYFSAMVNLILAELMTNLHSFIVVATNHAGDDLYRFERHCKPRSATFYLRQIISSANFATGTDVGDFLQGWLNYQIEHHMWPDLSMLSYQKAQPIVHQLCRKHGVPYVQQNVFYRIKKLVDIMVGDANMRKFPTAFEREADLVED